MNYKYISGEVLPLPEDTTWTDGMKLQDIYPNSSFVSGTKNPEGMKIHPVVKIAWYISNTLLKKDLLVVLV